MADTLVSGASGRKVVPVQVGLSAPENKGQRPPGRSVHSSRKATPGSSPGHGTHAVMAELANAMVLGTIIER